ncbi:hypothetical protein Tco_1277585 [Tanacetum coccineum]
MVDDRVKTLTMKHATLYVLEGLIIERKQSQADVAKMIANALQLILLSRHILHTTYEYGTFVIGESSSGQTNESEPGPSTSGDQEKLDDFDFWTNSYALDDDEIPIKKVSQELMD